MNCSNVWQELTDTQCEAVSGGILINAVTTAYFSVTQYPAGAGGGTIGVVDNLAAPGFGYTPVGTTPFQTVTPGQTSVFGVTGPKTVPAS